MAKKINVALTNLLMIHSQPQNFGTMAWWLLFETQICYVKNQKIKEHYIMFPFLVIFFKLFLGIKMTLRYPIQ